MTFPDSGEFVQIDDVERLQQALTRSADELTSLKSDPDRGSLEQRLELLTHAALLNVPGADLVGLTMRTRSGDMSSHGQTDDDVLELDRLQLQFGEGPCVDAIAGGESTIVEVADFALEYERWPSFAPAAVERGVHSVMSFGMAPSRTTPGAVNIYSRQPFAFDSMARNIGEAFALQAGVAVFGAQRVADLEMAVATRDVIGQAKGILMERHRINDGEAFELLVRASQAANMKLREVALWMIEELEKATVRDQGRQGRGPA